MNSIIGVVFDEGGRTYFFSPDNLDLKKGIEVIVETERGLQFAKTVTDIREEKSKNIILPLKRVLRIATNEDITEYKRNIKDAKQAIEDCNRLIKKHNLDMRLLDATFTFDRKQLIFHFLADNRVDFRDLAKDLAQIYKTRIELRQIGVRDKAKTAGGIGPCGRLLCCSKFLTDFDSVSINMAKNQNLALNPSKINGVCGRLLCCLNYEDENYKELKKGLPELGKKIQTEKGEGKVVAVDILKRTYRVYVEDYGYIDKALGDN
jgi:cell fate regulator YaaT (PSP1 superfamily)